MKCVKRSVASCCSGRDKLISENACVFVCVGLYNSGGVCACVYVRVCVCVCVCVCVRVCVWVACVWPDSLGWSWPPAVAGVEHVCKETAGGKANTSPVQELGPASSDRSQNFPRSRVAMPTGLGTAGLSWSAHLAHQESRITSPVTVWWTGHLQPKCLCVFKSYGPR